MHTDIAVLNLSVRVPYLPRLPITPIWCTRRYSCVPVNARRTPDYTIGIKIMGLVETLSFQQIIKHLYTEGTVPVLPNLSCALRLCHITFSELSLQGEATAAAGAEALHAVAPGER